MLKDDDSKGVRPVGLLACNKDKHKDENSCYFIWRSQIYRRDSKVNKGRV